MTYVLLDVDCTIFSPTDEILPGARMFLDVMREIEVRVDLWSAGGRDHCEEVADKYGLQVDTCHDKLNYSLVKEWHEIAKESEWDFIGNPDPTDRDVRLLRQHVLMRVAEHLGRVPSVTVDDDPTEAIPGIPFVVADSFWGSLQSKMDAPRSSKEDGLQQVAIEI